MEVLQWSGLETLLFLAPPEPSQLEAHPNLQAIGIAGWSRSMSPGEMEEELPKAFRRLTETGAPIIHYKTCSTFDSSPQVGSIGKAFDLGQDLFGTQTVPILIGAPQLGRYTVFGNLFARSGLDSKPFRLDRHPTMTRHPITPMTEADLRLHFAEQTERSVELFDVNTLHSKDPHLPLEALVKEGHAGILFDVLYPEHLSTIGSLIEHLAQASHPLFTVGSSGIEYALTAAWDPKGKHLHRPVFGSTDQLLIMSGSCSPVTQGQNQEAIDRGFVDLPIATDQLLNEKESALELDRCVDQALKALKAGHSALLHTAMGPSDQRIQRTNQVLKQRGYTGLDLQQKSGRLLGPLLGQIMKQILSAYPLPRIGVAGGDSSGYIARELDIIALRAKAPLAPGSPLCSMLASGPLDQTEVIFKGGQVGHPDLWLKLLHGTQRDSN